MLLDYSTPKIVYLMKPFKITFAKLVTNLIMTLKAS